MTITKLSILLLVLSVCVVADTDTYEGRVSILTNNKDTDSNGISTGMRL